MQYNLDHELLFDGTTMEDSPVSDQIAADFVVVRIFRKVTESDTAVIEEWTTLIRKVIHLE